MSTIAQLLKQYVGDMLLDAEILLAYVLQKNRAYLHAFSEHELTSIQLQQFHELIAKRQQGMPIAYITGHREFWSLDLLVTQDTLIPRPETELLVEWVIASTPQPDALVADLGTGSGAIALALASERPGWQLLATDASSAALSVAKNNAKRLQIHNIDFYQGNWCTALPKKLFDVIVSNPPYIAEDDADLEIAVFNYEPRCALLAAENGLCDLRAIIEEARSYLRDGGWLVLEHGFRQGENVRSIFLKAGYTNVTTSHDFAGHERVTTGQWNF